MLRFLKENGYPVDLEFKTKPYEDKKEDFHGYQSDIFVDGHHFDTLIHADYRSRVHYANGFFASYNWESEGKYKWRGKENSHRENGDLNVEVGDWIVDILGKVKKVQYDDDPEMPWKAIKRHASEAEVENHKQINELVDLLNKKRGENKSLWESYGSELCAGEMIGEENHIEEQIEGLRHVSKTKV